jgi:protein TonB
MKINLLLVFLIFSLLTFAQQTKDCHCLHKQGKIKVYEIQDVDIKPQFPGGDMALLKYILENVKYNESNLPEDLQTTWYVKITIDSSGNTLNSCILKPLYSDQLSDFEKSLLEVFRNLPMWAPAERQGKKVAVSILFPIRIDWQ